MLLKTLQVIPTHSQGWASPGRAAGPQVGLQVLPAAGPASSTPGGCASWVSRESEPIHCSRTPHHLDSLVEKVTRTCSNPYLQTTGRQGLPPVSKPRAFPVALSPTIPWHQREGPKFRLGLLVKGTLSHQVCAENKAGLGRGRKLPDVGVVRLEGRRGRGCGKAVSQYLQG